METLSFDQFFSNLINIPVDVPINTNQEFLSQVKSITQHQLKFLSEKDLIGSKVLFKFKDNSDSISEYMWIIVRRISKSKDEHIRIIGCLINNSYISKKYKYGDIVCGLKEDIVDIYIEKLEMKN